MSRNQISFFATKSDLMSLLRLIQSEVQLQFVETGLFDVPIAEPIDSLLSVSSLGELTAGDHNHGPAYLAFKTGMPIEVRPVPQRRGGFKYAVDQLRNPKTLVFQPGGQFGDRCLIDGKAGTVSDDSESLDLCYLFRRAIQQQFTKLRNFHLGPEASDLLDQGWRLTTSIKSPALYDVRR